MTIFIFFFKLSSILLGSCLWRMNIGCERDTEMQKNALKLLGLYHAFLKFPGNLKVEEFGK